MSDVNLNETEETAALFVSTQKKKEEEKIAAREQAKRDAEAAEVARMEREVQEQKAKVKSQRAKTAKIIAVVIAAVVLIPIILLFIYTAMTSIDYAQLDFNSQYASSKDNYIYTFKFPDKLYGSVSENDYESGIQLDFATKADDMVKTKIIIFDEAFSADELVTSASVNRIAPSERIDSLSREAKRILQAEFTNAQILDEESADLDATEPGKFFYKCTFKCDGYSGGAQCWQQLNSKGDSKKILLICSKKGEDPTDSLTLRDSFFDTNSDEALVIPGGTPLESATCTEYVSYDDKHMLIKLPGGRFSHETVGSYEIWSDLNGASIIIGMSPMNLDFQSLTDEQLISCYQQLLDGAYVSKCGIFSNREALGDPSFSKSSYWADYKVNCGGIPYLEKYLGTMWTDEQTKEVYWMTFEVVAPLKDKAIYTELFTNVSNSLEDM
ncbi:hypothetical protein [Butyrivibrio sp. AC2005]|uniref:hypothetical protein n=1 Tax=Butyrivibrio sp. AC2005 TaxID=1280672 RepID=UPI000407D7C2|nr:hypothetical protein [Butyrivibrio sp. AC2005]